MAPFDANSDRQPLFSVVVAVYNDWDLLHGCLDCLRKQSESFDVIVVDDGSHLSAPLPILSYRNCFPVKILRQKHSGIAAARNLGSQSAAGRIIVFLDADSRVQEGCLNALADAVTTSPQYNFFQLNLVGDQSKLTGSAEELRLSAIQHHALQPNGCIRYLNTAGFAARREVLSKRPLFEPTLTRAEDTFLLAELAQSGSLPLFVPKAVVQHIVPMSLITCFIKDLRSGLRERKAYSLIASKGVTIRISNRERMRMLGAMWVLSTQKNISKLAWIILVVRQLLQRTASCVPLIRAARRGETLDGQPITR